jgi:hypothetical protein
MEPTSDYELKEKPVVIFDKRQRCYLINLPDGTMSATLFPLNHPDINNVSNTKMVVTSEVINFEKKSDRITQVETQNTIYKESQ